MAVRVVTPPDNGGGIIIVDEARKQCRLLHTEDDDELGELILDAAGLIEARTCRRFLTQTLEWVREDLCAPMVLPLAGPTDCQSIAVDQVTYVDLQGVTQTLDPSQYWARPVGQTLMIIPRWFVVWPWVGDGAERVVVRFTITGTLADVPPKAKRAAKLLVSHWYEHRDAVVGVDNRDSSTALPLGVEDLLTSLSWEVA